MLLCEMPIEAPTLPESVRGSDFLMSLMRSRIRWASAGKTDASSNAVITSILGKKQRDNTQLLLAIFRVVVLKILICENVKIIL